ncbi:MAG: MoxR family ATPase [Chloroflexi bacterium]|nr:MoxR family ATPase [Chloroflexota bacterium]
MQIESIDQLQAALETQNYVAERGLATAVYLSLKLQRPLFLEGAAGVGKTEVAKVLAKLLNSNLIRLQCYEGLDVNQAVYEWNYTRQMMHIRLQEARDEQPQEADLFGDDFLLERPLLQAIRQTQNGTVPVLLIDEIDRSDDEFEAFLLEILSDFQISIPEIGTIRAAKPPVVILTSNRTREIHDALKRRCLYHWIPYPTFEKELNIVHTKLPNTPAKLAKQVTSFVQELRQVDLYKIPGIAETLDWVAALVALNQQALTLEIVQDTLGVLLKYQDDIALIEGKTVQQILDRIRIGD